jgi:AcrR family transcriptional regulator
MVWLESYRPVWYSQPMSSSAPPTPRQAPTLEKGPGQPRRPARERLLAAADELFYEFGIHTVGIDRIIEHADVAKASLYDCYGSKEELIAAYLRHRHEARCQRVQKRLAQFQDPRDKILSVFDLLGELVSEPTFRGCAFVRASTEAMSIPKVKTACEESRAWLSGMFTSLAQEAGADDPQALGKQLVLLYDGASIAAHVDRNRNAANDARSLAAKLLPPPPAKRSSRKAGAGK